MSKIEGIERLEGRGITAKVTNSGKQFTTHETFAKEIGYPDAVESILITGNGKGRRLLELIDESFTVLAKGKHDQQRYGYVYVLESAGGERFLVGEHGLEITYPTTQDNTRLERMEYGELIEYEDEVNRAVRRKAYAEGYEQGKFDQRMETSFDAVAEVANNGGVNIEETQQEKRDRIVEQAKKDVEELISNGNKDGLNKEEGNITYDHIYYNVEFIVNKEKRTVVALVRQKKTDIISERGIAKCAPDDCFNAHIGKAIALRRALDLEIPDEYLYAPQPTEARIGDVVQAYHYNGTKPMKPFRVEGFRRNDPKKLIDLENGTWHTYTSFRINEGDHVIDDTRDMVRKCDMP